MKVTFDTARSLVDAGIIADRPVYLFGPPGIGKSAMLDAVANDNPKIGTVLFNSSQLDTIDYRGLPRITGDETVWAVPELFQKINDMATNFEYVLVGVDEVSQAPLHTTGVLYQMLQFKQVGPHKLADNVRFVAMGNLPKHGAGVDRPVNPVLLNRGIVAEWETVTPEEWLRWAHRNDIHPTVTTFIRQQGTQYLNAFDSSRQASPTPRSWETASLYLNKVIPNDESEDSLWDNPAIMPVLSATVGEEAAAQLGIVIEMASKLPQLKDINALLNAPTRAKKVDDRGAAMLLAAILATRCTPSNARGAMKYLKRLKWNEIPAVFLDILRTSGKLTDIMIQDVKFIELAAEYGDVLNDIKKEA